MFLSRGFSENHMFLPLAVIPVTHKICYSKNSQELSTDPSCPGSEDEFGDDWSLSPEKAMATHSSTLAWKIPGTGEPVGCRLWGRTESDTTEAT